MFTLIKCGDSDPAYFCAPCMPVVYGRYLKKRNHHSRTKGMVLLLDWIPRSVRKTSFAHSTEFQHQFQAHSRTVGFHVSVPAGASARCRQRFFCSSCQFKLASGFSGILGSRIPHVNAKMNLMLLWAQKLSRQYSNSENSAGFESSVPLKSAIRPVQETKKEILDLHHFQSNKSIG